MVLIISGVFIVVNCFTSANKFSKLRGESEFYILFITSREVFVELGEVLDYVFPFSFTFREFSYGQWMGLLITHYVR